MLISVLVFKCFNLHNFILALTWAILTYHIEFSYSGISALD